MMNGTGIKFGAYDFSEPEPLPQASSSRLLDLPGLYVVLVRDTGCSPRPFRPLYFGESGGVWSRATAAHENFASWRTEAGWVAPLYRSLCLLPGSTRSARQAAESVLISSYNPPCNDRLSVNLAALLGLRSR